MSEKQKRVARAAIIASILVAMLLVVSDWLSVLPRQEMMTRMTPYFVMSWILSFVIFTFAWSDEV